MLKPSAKVVLIIDIIWVFTLEGHWYSQKCFTSQPTLNRVSVVKVVLITIHISAKIRSVGGRCSLLRRTHKRHRTRLEQIQKFG